MEKIKATVEILTFNNEATIDVALESVAVFDELLVIDGGSTDKTLEIAKRYGAKIIAQDERAKSGGRIANFAMARNQGLAAASHQWFLLIDSDEQLTPKIVAEISEIAKSPKPAHYVWRVPRKYVLDGAIIDCATTYPNYQTRFFHRAHVSQFIKEVHERIETIPGERIGLLQNHMLVPLPPLPQMWRKWEQYIEIEKKRLENVSRLALMRRTFSTLKIILLYSLRLLNRFFCGGQIMPLSYEVARQEYNAKILFMLLGRFFIWKR